MKVEQPVKLQMSVNFAAVGGGVACGVLLVLLISSIFLLKFCHLHRYKLTEHFNSLRRGNHAAGNGGKKQKIDAHHEYSRSDMIIRFE